MLRTFFLLFNLIALYIVYGINLTPKNDQTSHEIAEDRKVPCVNSMTPFNSSCNNEIFEARKKRKGNKGQGEQIQIVNVNEDSHDDSEGYGESYEVIHESKKGRKKRGKKRKKGGYKKGGKKKYMKHITPIAICVIALKMIFQHFVIKKIAVLSALSFLLSKTAFVLSTLLALKQLFYSGHQEKSDNNGKLEVVHIPIRKKHPDFHERESDKYYNESPWLYRQDESPVYDNTFDNISPDSIINQLPIDEVPNAFDSNVSNNYQ